METRSVKSLCSRGLFAIAFVLGMGMTCQPPADTDGIRTGAALLPFDEARADQLWCPSGCGGKGGDCGDWWQVKVPGKGKLFVDVSNEPRKDDDGNAEELDPRAGIVVKLVDGGGADLIRAEAVGASPAALTTKASTGQYFVLIEPIDPKYRARLPYMVRVRFEAPAPKPPKIVKPPPPPPSTPRIPPPPPPPRFQTLTTAILELEGPPGRPTAVLLEGGRSAGLRSGLQGRIVDGGRTIAPVEIIEVFEGGSRARIVGPASGRISPSSEVQIDVPAGGP